MYCKKSWIGCNFYCEKYYKKGILNKIKVLGYGKGFKSCGQN